MNGIWNINYKYKHHKLFLTSFKSKKTAERDAHPEKKNLSHWKILNGKIIN